MPIMTHIEMQKRFIAIAHEFNSKAAEEFWRDQRVEANDKGGDGS
jgi:hypothetical protein